jgi:membrane-associated phospholipid phosphatase
MFSDHGVAAQRHMAVVWTCVLACALADAVWLPYAKLSFVASNWASLVQAACYIALVGILIVVAFHRLRSDGSRAGAMLRKALVTTELLYRTALPFGALLTAGATLSYVITAADLPLQDSLLARVDHRLGFDWLHFLDTTNSSPFVVALLRHVYETIGLVIELAVIWFCLICSGERLAEFLAILGLCTVGLCAGMWLVPAAGAFAYYRPASELFGNYSAMGEMWTFSHTFSMLRDGSLSVIDLSALDGVVSFPSFHTVLGVIAIYAVRDIRWLLAFVLPLNATMIVSTMPVGGHHLADVLAGAGLTLGAILLVRWQKHGVPAGSEIPAPLLRAGARRRTPVRP